MIGKCINVVGPKQKLQIGMNEKIVIKPKINKKPLSIDASIP